MPQSPYCEPEEVVVELDEQTPLAVSPRDVLDRVSGTMEGELVWSGGGEGVELGLSTEASTSPMTLEVTYEGGSMIFLDQELVEPEGQVNEVAVTCPDRLTIEVVVSLTASDGTLAEAWTSSLIVDADPQTGAPSDPSLAVDTPFASLHGTLSVTEIEPDTWSVSNNLRIQAAFSTGSSSGHLQVAVTDPEGTVRLAELGSWQTLPP
ncbi:MAG: hypothetical protein AAF799_18965 [Myxococcota bacterium]